VADPSADAIALIQAKVTDWSPSNQDLADSLNAPAVANPVPQAQVPQPYHIYDLVSATSAGKRSTLSQHIGYMQPVVIAQDSYHLGAFTDALALLGEIAQADSDAMKGVMAQTQPDPNWPAQIGWAESNLGRPADALDVAAARPAGTGP
jgi:hypothetical protein